MGRIKLARRRRARGNFYSLTFCDNTADVLVLKSVLASYTAVMLSVPTASVEVAYVAFPLLRVPVPSVVLPFLNVTVPVGVPVVEDFTVAVNVTVSPKSDGFNDDTTVVEVPALSTTWDNAAEVLPM